MTETYRSCVLAPRLLPKHPVRDAPGARRARPGLSCDVSGVTFGYSERESDDGRWEPIDIGEISRVAVERMCDFITRWRGETGTSEEDCPTVLGAEIGPRGDAYAGHDSAAVHADSVKDDHAIQIGALREAGAEVLFALTMTGVDESVAMASVCSARGSGTT